MNAGWLSREGRTSNGFTFLRLVLAVLVIFGHVWPLGGYGLDPLFVVTKKMLNFGDLPVAGFFGISGFLVTQSLFESSSARFFWKRFLRIFPGFWLGLLVSAFVIGPFIFHKETGILLPYFTTLQGGPVSYVLSNLYLEIHQWGMWNIFARNPWPIAFNGTFWTLYYEFACYVLLFCLGFLRNRFAQAIILVACLACWITMSLDPVPGRVLFTYPLIGRVDIFLSCFLAGAAAFCYKDYIPFKTWMFVASVVLVAVSIKMDFFEWTFPPCLTYLLLWMAAKWPVNIDRYGDYSYGMYIYGYPAQQLLSYYGFHQHHKMIFFVLSIVAAFPMAYISWKCVEKPALILKRINLLTWRKS